MPIRFAEAIHPKDHKAFHLVTKPNCDELRRVPSIPARLARQCIADKNTTTGSFDLLSSKLIA